MFSITDIRKFRIQLNPVESGFLLNNSGIGIALFDLIISYIFFFVVDYLFDLTDKMNISKTFYYSFVIPIGIIFHLIFKQNTYLNAKLFDKNEILYKLIFLGLLSIPIFF